MLPPIALLNSCRKIIQLFRKLDEIIYIKIVYIYIYICRHLCDRCRHLCDRCRNVVDRCRQGVDRCRHMIYRCRSLSTKVGSGCRLSTTCRQRRKRCRHRNRQICESTKKLFYLKFTLMVFLFLNLIFFCSKSLEPQEGIHQN